MKTLLSFLAALIVFPLSGFSQADNTPKAIPSAPIPATSPNTDPSALDGLWKVTWNDPQWSYGSIFQVQSGTVGASPYKVALVNGRSFLQGPSLGNGIPLKVAGNGTWTGQWGDRLFTIAPYAANIPSAPKMESLNGQWTCRIYGQTSTPFTIANGSITGWGDGAGSLVLEPSRLVATFPNGAQFWLYYVSPDEWLGFGKFPTDELSFRPVIWQRSAKP